MSSVRLSRDRNARKANWIKYCNVRSHLVFSFANTKTLKISFVRMCCVLCTTVRDIGRRRPCLCLFLLVGIRRVAVVYVNDCWSCVNPNRFVFLLPFVGFLFFFSFFWFVIIVYAVALSVFPVAAFLYLCMVNTARVFVCVWEEI